MLLIGDCREQLKTIADNSIDSIVTDPPYELGFMAKKWDSTGIAYDSDVWKECLRVLKPGGYLLAFSGSRTYHRMVCAIEDAGFEVRDQIMWVYGSGFPKGQNISKGINKKEEHKLEAKQWEGWNTTLKPAHEPIVMARKPLSEKTIVDNVLKWGTGAINIDGCRVETEDGCARLPAVVCNTSAGFGTVPAPGGNGHEGGRWPANLIHDGSEEVIKLFPDAGGGKGAPVTAGNFGKNGIYGSAKGVVTASYADSGSAARFFYSAKASKKDRNDGAVNNHPTVKPTDLMRYLCKLVTPPNGTVLDPFTGSGSTGRGAVLEGFNFIGIELDPNYAAIAKARIDKCKSK